MLKPEKLGALIKVSGRPCWLDDWEWVEINGYMFGEEFLAFGRFRPDYSMWPYATTIKLRIDHPRYEKER